MTMMNILLGADPEVFVRRAGELISGFNLIKGDKENPFPVKNGAVQVDGMALEFNIDPAPSEESFVHNINHVLLQLAAMVPDCELDVSPVAHFGKELIDEQPLEARRLGCEPDLNAYTGQFNTSPDQDAPFRTAAGHVHVGWTEGKGSGGAHKEMCTALARQLDLYLGLPSLLFDKDTERRELYGKAGAFRVKPYGMEYRTLSNKWVDSPELAGWVYRASYKALEDLVGGKNIAYKYGEEIATVINTSNVERALEIIEIENLEIPNVLG